MKNIVFRIIVLLTAATFFLNSCTKEDDEPEQPAPTTTSNPARDSAIADYNTNYIGSAVSNTGWTGSASICDPGTVSQSTHVAVIKRINYFRRMVGLNDNCTLDSTLYSQQQQTALMMTANNSLSHTPPTSWLCYTSAGATGAASSNIAFGSNSSASIWAFIQDNGSNNFAVGHRRWILHSDKQRFSYGSTVNAMALYVFYNDTNSIVPEFIAYPPKGYIPQSLVAARWSFGIPNANFSGATVTMTGPSGNVPLTIVSSTANYADNTIVWEPTGIDNTNIQDVEYTVTVSGIANATETSYTYSTKIFKP